MIPAIGFMVGFYIITRMLSLLIKRPDGSESPITNIFAGITILVALFGLYVLFTSDLSSMNFNSF